MLELEAERQARLDSEANAADLKEQLQKARAQAEDNQRDATQQITLLQQQIERVQVAVPPLRSHAKHKYKYHLSTTIWFHAKGRSGQNSSL